MPGYRIETCVIDQPGVVEQEWLDLQNRADCSYFQSWGWIGTWLEQIAVDMQPLLVNVLQGERRIGMGLFAPGEIKRHFFIHTRAMFLNEYPYDGKNMVIEYNGLLAERGYEETVYAEIIGYLLREYRKYDEFYFGAITDGQSLDSLKGAVDDRLHFMVNEESLAWQVDLSGVAPSLDAYLSTLSKNRRGQIRRSLRYYERNGPIQLDEARDTEEALVFLEGLKVLHMERWQSKGEQGSFANPEWENFHRSLIRARFEENEIQLLKVGNSGSTIGYLYNFIWRKCVYVQQTGFRIPADKSCIPGYVAHALAIAYNRSKGMTLYDFMHGDSLYKRILCNQSRKIYWVVLQRRRLNFCMERLVLGLARRSRALLN